jgi:hypothetical protein
LGLAQACLALDKLVTLNKRVFYVLPEFKTSYQKTYFSIVKAMALHDPKIANEKLNHLPFWPAQEADVFFPAGLAIIEGYANCQIDYAETLARGMKKDSYKCESLCVVAAGYIRQGVRKKAEELLTEAKSWMPKAWDPFHAEVQIVGVEMLLDEKEALKRLKKMAAELSSATLSARPDFCTWITTSYNRKYYQWLKKFEDQLKDGNCS